MDIITVAPSLDYAIPLAQVLPSATIIFDSLDVTAIKREELLKGDADLVKLFGGSGKDADTQQEARNMAGEMLADQLNTEGSRKCSRVFQAIKYNRRKCFRA